MRFFLPACPQTRATKLISNSPDYTSLLRVGGKIFLITQFEAPNPSSIYILEMTQNSDNGELTVKSTTPVNAAAFGGLWTLCAGSTSPWNSHLGEFS